MARNFDPKQFPNFKRAQRDRGPFAKIGDLKLASSKAAPVTFLIITLASAAFTFVVVFLCT